MAEDHRAIEAVSFVTSADARLGVLTELRAGPATQAALQSALDLPQSTLARNLGKLRDEGWVVETEAEDGGDGRTRYRLTALGAAAARDLQPVAARTAVLDRLTAEPDAFPLDEFEFDLERLATATWRLSSETEPYAVINRVRSVLTGSRTVESVRSHPDPASGDVLRRVAEDDGGSVESVVPAASLRTGDGAPDGKRAAEDADVEQPPDDADDDAAQDVAAGGAPAPTTAGDDDGRIRHHVVDESIDYSCIVVDGERVLLTGGPDGGMPSVLVETTDEAVLAWARARFERLRETAAPVDGGDP